jgi:hypothetical protein
LCRVFFFFFFFFFPVETRSIFAISPPPPTVETEVFSLHADKGRGKRKECLMLLRFLGVPCLVYVLLVLLSVCLEILLKNSFSVPQEEAPFSEFPRGGIGHSVWVFGKESPFFKVKGVLWTLSLVIIVSIVTWHKHGKCLVLTAPLRWN